MSVGRNIAEIGNGLYGVFIQFPDDYRTQMFVGGTGTAYTAIWHRRYKTGSSSWTEWAN